MEDSLRKSGLGYPVKRHKHRKEPFYLENVGNETKFEKIKGVCCGQ